MVKVQFLAQKLSIKKLGQKTMIGFSNMGSITDLKENKTLFMVCDCRSEILMIEYDHRLNMADLAIYQNDASFRAKMSLWQRLRYCWQVLLHKKPYADEIMLDNKKLLELKLFLSSLDLNPKIGV